MKRFSLRNLFAWLLAAFFVIGGTMNIFATEQILADYDRWGYPGWFHYLTGTLEWASAILMIFPATRLAGSALAGCVMLGAAATVLSHGEYGHAVPPLVVLALVCLNLWLTWRARNTA
ncbi:DoxX-like family protein [Lutimaribacter pacificus]|uniref:DoxX-like family protein n=1 Tax=Lutimaribacter pacificus TaxID=391948 RepID=A0A1H0NTV4_9RHOB|nr:DoxX family protein [Lutimaribacter pacificus]SDO96099.1 DoxX-like family protein [Lutimaribacter pacificus]SHK95215.1 DoxX-like family protein [Lutimaribacter pacificus]